MGAGKSRIGEWRLARASTGFLSAEDFRKLPGAAGVVAMQVH
jgi:hypothetical protein